jgi:dihydroorotate dehydrogenase (fumarate)
MKPDIASKYLGIELRSPVIVGACPMTINPESVRQLVCAGVGAVVLPSILQEQIDCMKMAGSSPTEATKESDCQSQYDVYNGGPSRYLETIAQLKNTFRIPIIASVSAASPGEWLAYVKEIVSRGADAIELNLQAVNITPNESAVDIEDDMYLIAKEVCESVSIPVAIKLSQRFTNISSVAHRMQAAGAEGLVLFSHSPQWDVDIDQLNWTIRWELTPANSFGGILEGIVRARLGGLDLSIAASGGIRSSEDALKSMIAGADAVMITSEVYRTGPDAVRKVNDGLHRFLASTKFDSLLAFQQARPSVWVEPENLIRSDFTEPLTHSTRFNDPTPVVADARGDSFGHRIDEC